MDDGSPPPAGTPPPKAGPPPSAGESGAGGRSRKRSRSEADAIASAGATSADSDSSASAGHASDSAATSAGGDASMAPHPFGAVFFCEQQKDRVHFQQAACFCDTSFCMMLCAVQATPMYGVTYGPLARVSSEMVCSSSSRFNTVKWQG